MSRFLLRRLAYLVAVLVAVTFSVSLMLSLPSGDPARALAGADATDEQVETVRESLDLDDPPLTRYLSWLSGAVRGDLGDSYRTGQAAHEAILERLPVTLELVVLAQILALLYAVPTALWSAFRPKGLVDRATTVLSLLILSTPSFVIGILLVRFIAGEMGWFPTGGWVPLTEDLPANLERAILPALALAAEPAGMYQRLLRGDTRRTLDEDYITMAESKGLRPRTILFRHSLRPSSFSLTTMIGIITARMIGGSVIVETVFGLPGLGRLLITSVEARDFITVQAVVAVIALGYVVINTFVDLVYEVLDPRVRAHAS